jgi:hypothetical protein
VGRNFGDAERRTMAMEMCSYKLNSGASASRRDDKPSSAGHATFMDWYLVRADFSLCHCDNPNIDLCAMDVLQSPDAAVLRGCILDNVESFPTCQLKSTNLFSAA